MPPSPLSRFLPPLLAALLPCTALAAVPDAAAFFKTPHIDQVELSPKGGYVATVTALPGGAAGLVVYDTADPSKFSIVIKTSVNENIPPSTGSTNSVSASPSRTCARNSRATWMRWPRTATAAT